MIIYLNILNFEYNLCISSLTDSQYHNQNKIPLVMKCRHNSGLELFERQYLPLHQFDYSQILASLRLRFEWYSNCS